MLIIEFYEGETKVAECPAPEVFGLTPDQQRSFWTIQDDRERSIKLRYEEDEENWQATHPHGEFSVY